MIALKIPLELVEFVHDAQEKQNTILNLNYVSANQAIAMSMGFAY